MTATHRTVDLHQLVPNPDNPRDTLGDLDELAASIEAIGLIQQLLVTPVGPDYMVVDGHRRYWAMRSIDYARPIPVEIRTMDRGERIAAAVAAGTFIRPISPIDQAKAFRALEEIGYTRAQIEQATGCNQPMISVRLRLLELSPQQQQAVHEGRMTLHQAKLATYELGRRRPDSAPRPPRARPTARPARRRHLPQLRPPAPQPRWWRRPRQSRPHPRPPTRRTDQPSRNPQAARRARLTVFATTRPTWFDQAACRDLGPTLFFPEGRTAERDAQEAIAVCRTCPVRLDCAHHALNEGEEWGVWGGLDEHTRLRVRRGRTRAHFIREEP